ncbi:MAG: hypothetical protein WC763_00775 [Candidatus Paceibacterota bacterium]|jgi:hypothetical protein
MEAKDQFVTLGQLETVLARSFDAFFVRLEEMVGVKIDAKLEVFAIRMEAMMDAKIEAFAVRVESMMDGKIEWLATSIQGQFLEIDKRFDRVEKKLDTINTELGRHHLRLLFLERERDF